MLPRPVLLSTLWCVALFWELCRLNDHSRIRKSLQKNFPVIWFDLLYDKKLYLIAILSGYFTSNFLLPARWNWLSHFSWWIWFVYCLLLKHESFGQTSGEHGSDLTHYAPLFLYSLPYCLCFMLSLFVVFLSFFIVCWFQPSVNVSVLICSYPFSFSVVISLSILLQWSISSITSVIRSCFLHASLSRLPPLVCLNPCAHPSFLPVCTIPFLHFTFQYFLKSLSLPTSSLPCLQIFQLFYSCYFIIQFCDVINSENNFADANT